MDDSPFNFATFQLQYQHLRSWPLKNARARDRSVSYRVIKSSTHTSRLLEHLCQIQEIRHASGQVQTFLQSMVQTRRVQFSFLICASSFPFLASFPRVSASPPVGREGRKWGKKRRTDESNKSFFIYLFLFFIYIYIHEYLITRASSAAQKGTALMLLKFGY